MEANIILATT